MTDGDLKELGITTFGPRRKMLLAIQGKLHQTKFNSAGEFFQTTENCLIFQKNLEISDERFRKNPLKYTKLNEPSQMT